MEAAIMLYSPQTDKGGWEFMPEQNEFRQRFLDYCDTVAIANRLYNRQNPDAEKKKPVWSTQGELANLLGIDPSSLRGFESGKRIPSLPVYFKMEEVLGPGIIAIMRTSPALKKPTGNKTTHPGKK